MKSPAEAGRLVGANYKNHCKYTKWNLKYQ